MDEENVSEGGEGDSSPIDTNKSNERQEFLQEPQESANTSISSSPNALKSKEQPDSEGLHDDHAKRFKMEEDQDITDANEIVPDKNETETNADSTDNNDKSDEGNGSGSTSSYCEASTSSSDTGTGTGRNKQQELIDKLWKPLHVLDSDDDPDDDGDNVDDDDDRPEDEMPRLPPRKLSSRGMRLSSSVMDNILLQTARNAANTNNEDDHTDSSPSTNGNTDSDSDAEENKPSVLLKPKPRHNWFIVPEIHSRQFGTSANKQSSVLFQRRCYGSLHCVERLELMYKLEKHSGCVNSINFHPNGELLASGSDDLDIVLWDWKLGNSLLSFDSKHKSNVFQSKFLPLSGDLHIVSCARDGQVRLAQVSAQEGLRSSRKLGCHRGPCHKLTVLNDQPQVVISVGEDGLILRHDLRNPKSEKIYTVRRSYNEVALYSISSNPLNSNEYCVAGRDYRVRTYDQRKGTETLNTYSPFEKADESQKSLNVTCAVYNHNGSEILASYNDEDIYLFDVNGTPGSYVHSYQGHRNGATIKGVNFFGPKSEFVITGSDCGYVYFWEKDSEAIVQWLRADDNGVVNCLEPHPQLPFLCTSGLDPDIKVWVPSYEHDPKLGDLASTVKTNLKARSQWSFGSYMSPSDMDNTQILWLLWRQLNNSSDQIRRVINLTMDDSSNPSSDNSSSSNSTSSPSDNDSDDDNSDGPGGCATS